MNKCDLEETKHMALEKFKALVEKEDFKWKEQYYCYDLKEVLIGPFMLRAFDSGLGSYIELMLAEVRLASYSDAVFLWNKKTTTKLYRDALEKHRKQVAEARAESLVARTWDLVMARKKEQENEENCKRMVAKMAEDCEKLQEALSGTTLREQMKPEFVEQLEANERKWWRFWS